eukprot:943631-Pelagomonas_calceolata.AAC.3
MPTSLLFAGTTECPSCMHAQLQTCSRAPANSPALVLSTFPQVRSCCPAGCCSPLESKQNSPSGSPGPRWRRRPHQCCHPSRLRVHHWYRRSDRLLVPDLATGGRARGTGTRECQERV